MEEERPVLKQTPDGLVLVKGDLFLRADFGRLCPRLQKNRLNGELLVKAAGFKKMPDDKEPVLIDATAGLGEDSLLLAAAGFHVILFEYDRTIAALLEDAMRRGAQDERLTDIISRMELIKGDFLAESVSIKKVDVIYLDPMFPERKKSGRIKKKFQLLQELEKPCENEEELLSAALSLKPDRVVIKRPLHAPDLAGVRPSYSLRGSSIRFDVILKKTDCNPG